jgi:signal transduction histidine kinase
VGTRRLPRATPFSDDERDRLRDLIRFDVLTAVTAVVVMLATYGLVRRTVWLPVLCVLVGGSGVVMALALPPAGRGDLEAAVRRLAVANWFVALAAASIAPFSWPLMVLAALLPAVLAPPYVPGPRLRWYLFTSLAVAVGAAAVGLLQDFSGFEDELPASVPPAVVIFFTPFLGWIVTQTALQNSTRLQSVLDQALDTNEQLRRSEEALARQAASLQASRARLVEATDRVRRRVERDLHDGAQQRLVALGLRLRLAQDQCRLDPEAAVTALGGLREEVHAVRTELRQLAHGVYPAVLTQHGLGAALAAAADRCPVPVDVRATGIGRLPPHVEAAVYFCCIEALQNAAKHAGAEARVDLCVVREGRELSFTVADDGAGFVAGEDVAGDGFDNMRDRLGAAGGTLAIHSTPGRGTTVAGSLPAIGS